jgi:hypothetical protein
MKDIKNIFEKIKTQIELLENIKQNDKIYLSGGTMYLQSPSPIQGLYRSLTGETRDLTFKYLELFISEFVIIYTKIKRTIKYIQDPLIINIIKILPSLKNKLINIINILMLTYPDNKTILHLLKYNLNTSC